MAPFFGMLTSKMEESLRNLNATLACPLPLCVLSLEGKGAKLSSVGDFHYIRNLYMGVWVVDRPHGYKGPPCICFRNVLIEAFVSCLRNCILRLHLCPVSALPHATCDVPHAHAHVEVPLRKNPDSGATQKCVFFARPPLKRKRD